MGRPIFFQNIKNKYFATFLVELGQIDKYLCRAANAPVKVPYKFIHLEVYRKRSIVIPFLVFRWEIADNLAAGNVATSKRFYDRN